VTFFHTAQAPGSNRRPAQVVPVGSDRRQLVWIRRCAWRGEKRGDQLRLLLGRQVARIVHGRRARRTAIAGEVQREHVEAGIGKVAHPAVALVGDIEGHRTRRPGAVHEDDHAIGQRGSAEHGARADPLTHVELRVLSFDRRHARLHGDVVVDRQAAIAVVAEDHLSGWRPPATKARQR
jgi:hypothetical protein